MKKVLALAVLAALTLSAFGQGQIVFNNRVTTVTPNVSAPIFMADGTTAIAGAAARAALLGGALGLAGAVIPASGDVMAASAGTLSLLQSPSTTATWATFRTGTLAGFVAVGTDSARNSGLAYGSQGLFQVVAWTGAYDTWTAAFDAWKAGTAGVMIGASNPLTRPVSLNPTDLDVPTLQGLESFRLVAPVIVPEPTSLALAGLGAAALLIFRRRN